MQFRKSSGSVTLSNRVVRSRNDLPAVRWIPTGAACTQNEWDIEMGLPYWSWTFTFKSSATVRFGVSGGA